MFRSSFEYMPWYAGKAAIREYLEDLNKDQKASSPSNIPYYEKTYIPRNIL
jgi:hypothetical protein